ncbi:MAG: Fe-S cluster assembly protein SufD [Myxococcota bacterium]|nr:Fe-S cluster assembly protein SufD [Myxococcota bacterium]
MSALEEARDRFLRDLSARPAPSADEPAFLERLRREGREAFAARGLPHSKLEEWRYTNLEALARVPFEAPPEGPAGVDRAAVERLSFPVFACSLYVFVNGRFAPELSSPRALAGGVRAESLAGLGADAARLEGSLGGLCDPKEHPFAALNTAFLEDGAVLELPRGAQLDQAVHLVFVTSAQAPVATHPRVLVRAGAGSRATVIQDHVSLCGDAEHLTNAVTEVELEADASLDLVLLEREAAPCFLVSNLACRQARDSRFTAHTVTLGGRLVRNDASVLLAEEGAECALRGLFVGADRDVLDNHTLVDHAVPHGTSHELYKGILGGRSRGVFRGRVRVRPDAQKTVADQSNPNLLLADGAEIDTKPQLEIHADDVKCSHGSAIGRIEPDALFYLRTRGIPEPLARRLLTEGFAWEILSALPHPALGEALGALLAERLEAAHDAGGRPEEAR